MRTFREQNNSHAKWGANKDNITFPCFTFADDVALLAETKENEIKQVEDLKKFAEKAGLQISFQKTEIMPKSVTKYESMKIKTKYGEIKMVNNSNISEKWV